MKFSAILTRERRSVKRTKLDQSWSMNAPCSRETVWKNQHFNELCVPNLSGLWWIRVLDSSFFDTKWILRIASASNLQDFLVLPSTHVSNISVKNDFSTQFYSAHKSWMKLFRNDSMVKMIRIRFEICIQMLMERWKLLNLRVTAASKSVSDRPFDTLSPHSTPHNHYKTNFKKHVFPIFLLWWGSCPDKTMIRFRNTGLKVGVHKRFMIILKKYDFHKTKTIFPAFVKTCYDIEMYQHFRNMRRGEHQKVLQVGRCWYS